MSKGPGKVEQAILRTLEEAEGCLVSEEKLRWHLLGRVEGWEGDDPESDYPSKRKQAIGRAVQSLANTSTRIELEERKLETIQEVLDHYPHKTDDPGVRRMRQELLPLLLQEKHLKSPFSRAHHERYLLEQPEARPLIADLQRDWPMLERDLMGQFDPLEPNKRQTLFTLIAIGKSLFARENNIHTGLSFAEHVETLMESQLNPGIKERLQSFQKRILPERQEAHLQLKSRLYRFTQFGRGKTETGVHPFAVDLLYREHKEAMTRHDPDLVEKLEPIYARFSEPRRVRSRGRFNLNDRRLMQDWDRFDRNGYPLIDQELRDARTHRLLDSYVLYPYRFLRLPG